jgi:Ca2+/H+ antiporter, TMEM165/GDT1 family
LITALAVAFGVNFFAELPDKTMFATIVLSSRYRRPWAVFAGVMAAFTAHALLAVVLGEALRRLPATPVQLAVAVMFAIGGILVLRSGDDDDDVGVGRPATSGLAVFAAAAAVVGVAEFGDFTQLATVGVVAKYGYPAAVAFGSVLAHVVVAGSAVVAGDWLQRRLPVRVIQRVAGVLFIVFAMATLATVIW